MGCRYQARTCTVSRGRGAVYGIRTYHLASWLSGAARYGGMGGFVYPSVNTPDNTVGCWDARQGDQLLSVRGLRNPL